MNQCSLLRFQKPYEEPLHLDLIYYGLCIVYIQIKIYIYIVYKKIDLAQGKLQSICDDDEDMLLITYEDGMQIDVGYIEDGKTYYITVVKDDTVESWNNPLGVFSTNDKSKLPTELQKAIHKFRNI